LLTPSSSTTSSRSRGGSPTDMNTMALSTCPGWPKMCP
jgi:hypothetical protein